MSGTGQPNQQAPTRLTPIAIDQPIADVRTGQPTPYFAQAFQRVLSYLGQPGSGTSGTSSGGGLTISQQIDNLTTEVQVLQVITAAGNPPQSGTISRLAALEATIRNLLRFQRSPRTVVPRVVVPAAPAPRPDFTGAQILSWWRQ